MVAGVSVGSTQISPADTLGIVVYRMPGWTSAAPGARHGDDRLGAPAARVLTAAVVGAGLAIAGATFQGIVRNPLADPYVLGTSSGAALGLPSAILLPVGLTGFSSASSMRSPSSAPSPRRCSCSTSAGPAGLAAMTRLLLTGYAVGFDAGGIPDDGDVRVRREPAGDLLVPSRRPRRGILGRLLVAAPLILAGCLAIAIRARSLDGLLLGEPRRATSASTSGESAGSCSSWPR